MNDLGTAMKKMLAWGICGIMALGCACTKPADASSSQSESSQEESKLLTVEEIMQEYSVEDLQCGKYDLDKYVTPYWESQVIYNENACFYKENGKVLEKKLMYKPAKILEVRNYGLDVLYEEGKDYVMSEQGITWVEGSAIPVTDFDFYYLDRPLDKNAAFRSISNPDKYIAYNEFQRFTNMQISVTYIRTEAYTGPQQEYSDKLDGLVNKLSNREELTFLFYGDSIMEGCNASGYRGYAPAMPKFSEMITEKLMEYYGYTDTKINHINNAVGGWLSSTGIEQWNNKNAGLVPDCFIVNFGCNDGTFSVHPDAVLNNMRNMISRVKAANPDCAIIMISPLLPNKDAQTSESEATVRNFYNNQEEYEPYFVGLAEEYPDAVTVQLTSLYNWVLQRKEFIDIMASNVSHPNDFFIRFYAQAVLTKLINGRF